MSERSAAQSWSFAAVKLFILSNHSVCVRLAINLPNCYFFMIECLESLLFVIHFLTIVSITELNFIPASYCQSRAYPRYLNFYLLCLKQIA
jgi:hypothetical protein